MERKLRTAICGCEGHVEKFGRLINSYPESETVAVWDNDPREAQRVADEIGTCRVFESYDELLADPTLDGVVIVSAAAQHAEMILKAAAAGKHIFVEKPVTVSVEEAYAVEKAVRAAGIKFFMTDPFVENTTQYLKGMMESGKLGQLLSVRIKYGSFFDLGDAAAIKAKAQRFGGGMMADTGGHPLHGIYYLLGQPQEVFAQFNTLNEAGRDAGYEQSVNLVMTYPQGVSATVNCDVLTFGFTNMIEVCGTEGAAQDISLGNHTNKLRYRLRGDADWTEVSPEELGPKPEDHVRYWVRMMAYGLPNDGVGTDPLSTHGMNLEDSVALVELREAIYRSAASGRMEPVKK